MKALTLWQPWASLIALGVKTIETRSWSTSYRGPLAIHAAAKRPDVGDVGGYGVIPAHGGVENAPPGTEFCLWSEPAWHPLALGCVVATCTLVDVVPIGDDDPATWPPERRSAYPAWSTDGTGWADAIVIAGGGQPLERREGQRPYGDFTAGRFAWLLADITPLPEPVPAHGRQQLWDWHPVAA